MNKLASEAALARHDRIGKKLNFTINTNDNNNNINNDNSNNEKQ